MASHFVKSGRFVLGVVGVFLCLTLAGHAQAQIGMPPLPPLPSDWSEDKKILDRYPDKPTLPPVFTVPVGPLGFSAPGVFYLLRRHRLVSLDFLDENRLLFSFQTAGLVSRDAADETEDKERQIRAVVVTLPDGKIECEARWTVPDQARYLWMLKDGRFLLRDTDGLAKGDAALHTAPFLQAPGRLLWIEMDPAQQIIVTNSLETAQGPKDLPGSNRPATGQATITGDKQKLVVQPALSVRTMQLASGQLIRRTQVPWTNQGLDWPINSDGYLESVKSTNAQWLLNLNNFAGGSKLISRVTSACSPTPAYVSAAEILVTTCDPGSGGELTAMSTTGNQFWQVKTSTNEMWPLLVIAQDGSRFLRETLILKRTATRYKRPLNATDLKGQMVRVFDAADGKMKFEAPVSPLLDGGGNVAISPSGRRVAILNDGAIQVFELAAPIPFPVSGAGRSAK